MALNLRAVPSRASTNGSWKPGQSGNPNGRPADKSAQQLAYKYVPDAFKALVIALNFKGERVAAAKEILDRAYGRPKQVIEGPDGSTIHLHLLAAKLVSEEILMEMKQPPTINAEPEKVPANLLDAPLPSE